MWLSTDASHGHCFPMRAQSSSLDMYVIVTCIADFLWQREVDLLHCLVADWIVLNMSYIAFCGAHCTVQGLCTIIPPVFIKLKVCTSWKTSSKSGGKTDWQVISLHLDWIVLDGSNPKEQLSHKDWGRCMQLAPHHCHLCWENGVLAQPAKLRMVWYWYYLYRKGKYPPESSCNELQLQCYCNGLLFGGEQFWSKHMERERGTFMPASASLQRQARSWTKSVRL